MSINMADYKRLDVPQPHFSIRESLHVPKKENAFFLSFLNSYWGTIQQYSTTVFFVQLWNIWN